MLPLLVALALPLAVTPASADPVVGTVANHPGSQGFGHVRLDHVGHPQVPAHQTWSVSGLSSVPVSAGPDAVCPVAAPWPVPCGRGHVGSAAASSRHAHAVAALRGRSPPPAPAR